MMQRPNIRRMQKHSAKSTPDHITTSFSYDDMVTTDVYPKWMGQFQKRMRVKHGDQYRGVDVETHHDDYRFEVFFAATVRLHTPRPVTGREFVDLAREGLMTPDETLRRILWNGN